MIWFTSDLHFGHDNILKFCPNRQFDVIQDMNEFIITTINRYVKSEDTLVIVGDFCLGSSKQVRYFLNRINAKTKILVKGNHCRNGVNHTNWDLVVTKMSVLICKQPIEVNHYPYGKTWWDKFVGRFISPDNHKRPLNKGGWLIHGHTHKIQKVRDKMINVCWDAWDRPVSLKEIEMIIQRGKHAK